MTPHTGPALLAQVAVADATLYYDKLYTYRVPSRMEGHIFVGSLVLAPFGRGRARPRVGVVIELGGAPAPGARLKPLWDHAPEDARLTDELLAVVRYLREATFCTWFEAVRAVIPYGAQYRPVLEGRGAEGGAAQSAQLPGTGTAEGDCAGAAQSAEDMAAAPPGGDDGDGNPGWRLKKQLDRYTETVYVALGGASGAAGEAVAAGGGPGGRDGLGDGDWLDAGNEPTAKGGPAAVGDEAARAGAGEAAPAEAAACRKKQRPLTEKQQAVLAFVAEMPRTAAEIIENCGVGPTVAPGLVKRGLLAAEQRDRAAGQVPDFVERAAPAGGLYALSADQARVAGKLERMMVEGWKRAGAAGEGDAADAPGQSSPNGPPAARSGSGAPPPGRPSPAAGSGVCPHGGQATLSPSGPPAARSGSAPTLPGGASPAAGSGCLPASPASQPSPIGPPALLHGVTGSGKTAVFLQLIQKALEAGKTALVLVPEIGLTPQMVGRLRGAFGAAVAVQHSGLSATDRLLQWRSIQRGEARVVVGTRSAVFAPLENIGLLVVDEEQERTYRSESAPRYDAIEVARRRAARHGALLLLASATPSVNSYHAAVQGRYALLELKERYGSLPLPAVELVDMRDELLAGNPGALSRRLAEAIEQAIAAGRQVILLLNRRGYHRVALCRACGKAVKCGECSVPMVFHRAGGGGPSPQAAHPGGHDGNGAVEGAAVAGFLQCHYCGRSQSPAPAVCPECGGELRYAGFGTQRLEDELAQRLPGARVLRMDLDTTSRKGSHTDMLARFAAGQYDILLGTQMVAKGLDFERVSLVGVVGIDALLFSQGYRAYENVFSLVTQVVGRGGRARWDEADGAAPEDGPPALPSQSLALIQTVDPANPVLALAAAQDYPAFYRQEIEFRRLALYPPFCALCLVGFAAKEEADALAASRRFAALFTARAAKMPGIPLRVLGPAPMPVVQVAGSYRYRLTIKCKAGAAFRALVRQTLADYNEEGLPRTAGVWLDFGAET